MKEEVVINELSEEEAKNFDGGASGITKIVVHDGQQYTATSLFKGHNYIIKLQWAFGGCDSSIRINGKKYSANVKQSNINQVVRGSMTFTRGKQPALAYIEVTEMKFVNRKITKRKCKEI